MALAGDNGLDPLQSCRGRPLAKPGRQPPVVQESQIDGVSSVVRFPRYPSADKLSAVIMPVVSTQRAKALVGDELPLQRRCI